MKSLNVPHIRQGSNCGRNLREKIRKQLKKHVFSTNLSYSTTDFSQENFMQHQPPPPPTKKLGIQPGVTRAKITIGKISVISPIVIDMPTRELLAGETKSSFV